MSKVKYPKLWLAALQIYTEFPCIQRWLNIAWIKVIQGLAPQTTMIGGL